MINEALATLDDITHWAPAGSCKTLQVLRLDKLHPVVSGNKWFKLKYNASAAKAADKTTLLTFGGGYSNHLVAAAFASKECGLQSIGMVRGNYSGEHFTTTLRSCEAYGMRLIMLGKREYGALSASALFSRFPDAYIIPEGGANESGIRGAAEIAAFLPENITDVCVAMGSGTTLNGLHTALPPATRLHGFYVARDFERAEDLLRPHNGKPRPVIHPVKDLRFGKWTNEALDFIRSFKTATGIPLDVVYTYKMMMKVADLLREGFFTPHSRIVCIHTGGLQGNPAGLFPH